MLLRFDTKWLVTETLLIKGPLFTFRAVHVIGSSFVRIPQKPTSVY